MIAILIVCLIVIGVLGYLLYQKHQVDQDLLNEYNRQLEETKDQISFQKKALSAYESKLLDTTIKYNTEYQKLTSAREQLENCQNATSKARQEYNELVNVRTKEIDQLMDEQRQRRQESLDETFREKKAVLESELDKTLKECDKQAEEAKKWMSDQIEEAQAKVKEYQLAEEQQHERFLSLREPLLQYEKDKQAKLFYTIQLPEEYHDDIEFLLTTVAKRLSYKDIIYKLIWNEYIKPSFDDLVKRIELKSEPGIYKITSIIDGKCYIGKSTDVKKRLTEHIKGALGLSTISDQEIHRAIKDQGFDNWIIEIITYCEKEKLSELEKYYINFFKSQEWGYNKRAGG